MIRVTIEGLEVCTRDEKNKKEKLQKGIAPVPDNSASLQGKGGKCLRQGLKKETRLDGGQQSGF